MAHGCAVAHWWAQETEVCPFPDPTYSLNSRCDLASFKQMCLLEVKKTRRDGNHYFCQRLWSIWFFGIATAEVPGCGAAGWGAAVLLVGIVTKMLCLQHQQPGSIFRISQLPSFPSASVRSAEIGAPLDSRFCAGGLSVTPGRQTKGCSLSPSSDLEGGSSLLWMARS